MGLKPQTTCPFCGSSDIRKQNLLKPWGFAPINGTKTKEVYTTADMSYAETPRYSYVPSDSEMETPAGFAHLRISRRSDDPLIIVNKGIGSKDFFICMDCDAAAPADNNTPLEKLPKPYRHPHKYYQCHHDGSGITTVFLGHQFRTDLVVYEIALDATKININVQGLWIARGGQSLAEAMTFCVSDKLLEYALPTADTEIRRKLLFFLTKRSSGRTGYFLLRWIHVLILSCLREKVCLEADFFDRLGGGVIERRL